MRKKLLTIGIFALFMSSVSTAATFNFILEAEDDERGGAPLTFSNSGIDLTASGEYYNGQNWQAANAYLDDHWNGHGDAGLGVCKTITSSLQCNPGSDDNVTIGEKLILDFGQQVTISEIIMADGEHGTAFTGDYRLLIDNIEILGSHSLAALLTLSSFTGQVFEFWNDNDTEVKGNEFYISSLTVSAVPIPAAAFLFAPALLGFMGLRCKAKNSVA